MVDVPVVNARYSAARENKRGRWYSVATRARFAARLGDVSKVALKEPADLTVSDSLWNSHAAQRQKIPQAEGS